MHYDIHPETAERNKRERKRGLTRAMLLRGGRSFARDGGGVSDGSHSRYCILHTYNPQVCNVYIHIYIYMVGTLCTRELLSGIMMMMMMMMEMTTTTIMIQHNIILYYIFYCTYNIKSSITPSAQFHIRRP